MKQSNEAKFCIGYDASIEETIINVFGVDDNRFHKNAITSGI